jgi:AraC-like DNA-binding protein
MIREDNGMIAGCIDKMRRDSCGGCRRRSSCAEFFPFMFGARGGRVAAGSARGPSGSPFLAFLGEVAKAFETQAGQRPAPANAFRAEVERRLEPLLASGEVGIERIAGDLGCSRQTLYRRLKTEGTTYEQLLDGLRKRLALRFMREGLSVKEAGYRLGFSDPAAFSRAFTRWPGRSPSDMRTRH